MSYRPRLLFGVAAVCFVAFGTSSVHAAAQNIFWSDLRPTGSAPKTPDMSSLKIQPQHDGALSWNLQDKPISLTGYALPVDREGDLVYEFMLLPLTGMCSHVPPPPPNQIVRVSLAEPFRMSEAYEPVSVTGTLRPGLEKTQLFILDGVTVIESGYSVGKAEVAKADKVPDAMPSTGATPWKFLKK
jgi:hypothetical protein